MYQILTVEDNNSMRSMISYTLEAGGHKVIGAEDGLKGIELADFDDFDLIVTDINMPNMNGIEFVEKIRQMQRHKATPIIVLSTESSEDTKKTAKDAGANGWITKPFSPRDLIDQVNKYLN